MGCVFYGAGINIQPVAIYIGPIADNITPSGILITPEVVSSSVHQWDANICVKLTGQTSLELKWHWQG